MIDRWGLVFRWSFRLQMQSARVLSATPGGPPTTHLALGAEGDGGPRRLHHLQVGQAAVGHEGDLGGEGHQVASP